MALVPDGARAGRGGATVRCFLLRTPLLPFDDLARWSQGLQAPLAVRYRADLPLALEADRARLRAGLRAALDRPEVREALFLASPTLEASIDSWLREPDSARGRSVERSLVRYFFRLTTRPTPFGTLAGCSIGSIGTQTRLELGDRGTYKRHVRLDMTYLLSLTQWLEQQPQIRERLAYRPNSSAHTLAGTVRYQAAAGGDDTHAYRLVVADEDRHLRTVLDLAHRHPSSIAELAAALTCDDISITEARRYVHELIDAQLLVSDLAPAVTGDEPAQILERRLRGWPPAAHVANQLDQALIAIDGLSQGPVGSGTPSGYRRIAGLLERLPPRPDLSRLFQVDLIKPVARAELGMRLIDDILKAVGILRQASPPSTPEHLARFRDVFQERYGDREMPLTEVLDEELGIGFSPSTSPSAEVPPLLERLHFPAAEPDADAWDSRQALLLRKLLHGSHAGSQELLLEPSDLEAFGSEPTDPLPDTFAVVVCLAAPSATALARGDVWVLLHGVLGPSGARLLGRFCHADAAVRGAVQEHLRAEEVLAPDRIFAEVVHLPDGRSGNILLRPVLREYEIPYLAVSGLASERQIPISDLLVSVQGERILLRSRRLGREVVPRVTAAHNYTRSDLGVYRFLCALQHQTSTGELSWDWGCLADAPFLPRVRSGRVVLARASWGVDAVELRPLLGLRGAERFRALHEWRCRRRVPRLAAVADQDSELLVDFDNVLSVESFAHLARSRSRLRLVEMFPSPDDLCAVGPEGRFVHELVIPVVNGRQPSAAPPYRSAAAPRVRRQFGPGSEWLYAKLYTGTRSADTLLAEQVRPLVRTALDGAAADRWFFIRYGDPDWHLRLRLHGDPRRLRNEVLPCLHDAAAGLLNRGLLWRLQLDTYEREVERYGGDQGILLAEAIFHHDSEFALQLLELVQGDEGKDARWWVALAGVDQLLSDFGLTTDQKLKIADGMRDHLSRQLRADHRLRRQLGELWSDQRKRVAALLGSPRPDDAAQQLGAAALSERRLRLAGPVEQVRRLAGQGRLARPLAELAASYAHMHVNRVLRSAHQAQELVVHDILARYYRAQLHRSARIG